MTGIFDAFQRQINYLRVSVTDHCNLNCIYCSAGSVPHLPREEILSYEEIHNVVLVAVSMGISKVRLTGGEPLLRPELSKLVRMLSRIEGIDDISLTTNGRLLSKYASELKEAGLHRVNISLDTLKADKFKLITSRNGLAQVLSGIEAAYRAGLDPVKINTVVMRGINDNEIIDFARMAIDPGWNVRFIEFMPLGTTQAEASRTMTAQEIRDLIETLGPLEPYSGKGNGPARYYRLSGARGTVGFISPMSEHFCHTCNRLRLTADGHLRPCLLDDDEIDLKAALRDGATVERLGQLISQAVASKGERHHLNEGVGPRKRPMRQIGG
jgi:cyclic pyranopterin phosphate synthase